MRRFIQSWRAALIGFSELYIYVNDFRLRLALRAGFLSSKRTHCRLHRHYCARLGIAQWINSRREKRIGIIVACVSAFLFYFHLVSMMHRELHTENAKLKFSHLSNNNNERIFAAPELRRQFNHQLMMLVQRYLHWKFYFSTRNVLRAREQKTCTRAPCSVRAGYVLSAYTQITLR